MNLYENERVDYVNDDISLIQKTDGLTFGTDALLLAGYVDGKFKDAVELGGGSGIISMLLLSRKKCERCTALEVQEEYASLIERNAEYNSLSERLTAVHTDVREYKSEKECELVFTNPPYMKVSSGRQNENEKKTIARHEVFGDISDFIKSSSRMLKYGGAFYAVYRPDRLVDIIAAMREFKLEPKRMTFVLANERSEASMVLIEGKKGAFGGLKLTRPLIIYKDEYNKEYSSDMNYIMENGSFPKDYGK